jgi:hypothetical protein
LLIVVVGGEGLIGVIGVTTGAATLEDVDDSCLVGVGTGGTSKASGSESLPLPDSLLLLLWLPLLLPEDDIFFFSFPLFFF